MIASLTVPVKAEQGFFDPKDYFHCVNYDGNIEYLCYGFGDDAYYSIRDWASGETIGSYGGATLTNVWSEQPYLFRIYPLGEAFVPGNSIRSGVIEIADFKSNAVFEVKQCIDFTINYEYSKEADGDTSLYFETTAYACFYDSELNFISQITSSLTRTDITLTGSDPNENYGYNVILDVDMPLVIPENAVYMVPCILSYLYPPTHDAPHMINLMDTNVRELYVQISKNLLVDQSDTLNAIDDQLGDLNDKADSILNGNEHQQGLAQDGSEKVEQNQQTMDEVLASLEDYEQLDANTGMEAIRDFLEEDGWRDVEELLRPLLQWEPTVTIMLIVLSLINLSVILFGR